MKHFKFLGQGPTSKNVAMRIMYVFKSPTISITSPTMKRISTLPPLLLLSGAWSAFAAADEIKNQSSNNGERKLQQSMAGATDMERLQHPRQISSIEDHLQFAKDNGIDVRHTFINADSIRILGAHPLHSTRDRNGAKLACSFVSANFSDGQDVPNSEYRFALLEKECPP